MEHKETMQRVEALLLNQKTIFNVDELSQYTGLSKSFIYKLTSSRKIPFSRPNGKLIFFKKEEIDNWLTSNPIATSDDIEQEAVNFMSGNSSQEGETW